MSQPGPKLSWALVPEKPLKSVLMESLRGQQECEFVGQRERNGMVSPLRQDMAEYFVSMSEPGEL